MIFNNGLGRDLEYSSVEIISPPLDNYGNYILKGGLPFGPKKPDWEYKDEENFFSEIVGSAQRLPNGNTLICSGMTGYIFEIDSINNKVWEYKSPVSTNGVLKQGELATKNVIFRAIKYAPNYPGFKGKNLTPVELN